MKKKWNRIIGVSLCTLLLLVSTGFLGDRYMPQRTGYGATWHMFFQEDTDSIDVLCLGASYAYCSTLPAQLYRQTGFTVYDLCAPQLTLQQSYYYLREALQTQSPHAVYLEATGMFFDRYTDYTKVNIGYMPFGYNRLLATFRAAEPQQRLGLLFPLYNYHDRWTEVPVNALFAKRTDDAIDPWAGFTCLTEAQPQYGRGIRQDTLVRYRPQAYESALQTLTKIQALCAEKNIALYLYIAPAAEVLPQESLIRLVQSVQALALPLYDFNSGDRFAALSLDFAHDFYDPRHLNLFGAVKFSNALAVQMCEDLAGFSPTPHDQSLWENRVATLDDTLYAAN